MSETVVIGLDDAKRDLLNLPNLIVQDLFPDALKAGGDVIEGELGARTPEADSVTTSAREYGTLRDDLSTKIEVEQLAGSAKVGFNTLAYLAAFLEYGHKKVTHAGKEVGEVKGHPFMREAADAAEDGAVEAFADSLGEKQ